MENSLKNWLKQVKTNESTISMLLGVLVVLVVGVLLINYFKSTRPAPQLEPEAITTEEGIELEQKEGKMVPKALPTTHVVAQGEHLWAIAEKHYGSGYNWVDIAEANGLRSPNWLLVGQELTIPQVEVKKPAVIEGEVEAAVQEVVEQTIVGDRYTVAKGDDLWKIAVRAYGDGYRWPDIFEANRDQVADPDLIEIGMELALPR